jgi:Flp pilus assembly pilin Flp
VSSSQRSPEETKSASEHRIIERKTLTYFKKFLREEDGQDLVEYGLLAAFISIAAIVTVRAIGPLVHALYVPVRNVLSGV